MLVTSIHNTAPSRPPSPLSPRTISSLLNQFPHEDAKTMQVITQELLSTIQKRKVKHFAEKNWMQSNVEHLKKNILNLTANWNTCPEGYKENRDKVPGFVIPVGEGLYRPAKWIKRVEAGKVAGYADVQGPHNAPYITEIYAFPDFNVEMPCKSITPWFRNMLKGNVLQFAMLLKAVEELEDWRISTDVRHYREFDDQVIYLRNQKSTKSSRTLPASLKCVNSPNFVSKRHDSTIMSDTYKGLQDDPSILSLHDEDIGAATILAILLSRMTSDRWGCLI